MQQSEFARELSALLNRYNFDTVCDTPDFVLAEYIVGHLAGLTNLVRGRDKFLGRQSGNEQLGNRRRKAPRT